VGKEHALDPRKKLKTEDFFLPWGKRKGCQPSLEREGSFSPSGTKRREILSWGERITCQPEDIMVPKRERLAETTISKDWGNGTAKKKSEAPYPWSLSGRRLIIVGKKKKTISLVWGRQVYCSPLWNSLKESPPLPPFPDAYRRSLSRGTRPSYEKRERRRESLFVCCGRANEKCDLQKKSGWIWRKGNLRINEGKPNCGESKPPNPFEWGIRHAAKNLGSMFPFLQVSEEGKS